MGSFLVLLGASWGFFWCSWGFQVASRILKTFYLGTLEPPSWPPRSPQQPQTAPQAPNVHLKLLFFLSWSLRVSILNSQADPPTFKNLDFALAGARFLTSRLGIKRWSLRCLGALLGSCLVSLGRPEHCRERSAHTTAGNLHILEPRAPAVLAPTASSALG